MEIKIISEDEIHLVLYDYFKYSHIYHSGRRFDLIQVNTDRDTKRKTYMFVANY